MSKAPRDQQSPSPSTDLVLSGGGGAADDTHVQVFDLSTLDKVSEEAAAAVTPLQERTYWQVLQDLLLGIANAGVVLTNWTGLLQRLGFYSWEPRQTWAEVIAQGNAKRVFDHIQEAAKEDRGNGQTMEVFLQEVLYNFPALFTAEKDGNLTSEQTETLKNLWKLVTETLDTKPFPLLYTLFDRLKKSKGQTWYETDNIFRVLTSQYPGMFLDLVLLAAKNANSLTPVGKGFFKDLLSYIWKTGDDRRLTIIATYLIDFMQKEPASGPVDSLALVVPELESSQASDQGGGGGAAAEPEKSAPLCTDEERTLAVLSLLCQIPHPNILRLVLSKAEALIQYRHPNSSAQMITEFKLNILSFSVFELASIVEPFIEVANRWYQKNPAQEVTRADATKAATAAWTAYLGRMRLKLADEGITGLDESKVKKLAIRSLLNQFSYSDDPLLHHSTVRMLTEMSVCLDPLALINLVSSVQGLIRGGLAVKKVFDIKATVKLLMGDLPEAEKQQRKAGAKLFDKGHGVQRVLSDPNSWGAIIRQQVSGFIEGATAVASIPIEAAKLGTSAYALVKSLDIAPTRDALSSYLELSAAITPGYDIATLQTMLSVMESDAFRTIFDNVGTYAMQVAIEGLVKKAASVAQDCVINRVVGNVFASAFSIAMAPVALAMLPVIGPVAAAAMVPLLLGAAQRTSAWTDAVASDQKTLRDLVKTESSFSLSDTWNPTIKGWVQSFREAGVFCIRDLSDQSVQAAQAIQQYYRSGLSVVGSGGFPCLAGVVDTGCLVQRGEPRAEESQLAPRLAAAQALQGSFSPNRVLSALKQARIKQLKDRKERLAFLLQGVEEDSSLANNNTPSGLKENLKERALELAQTINIFDSRKGAIRKYATCGDLETVAMLIRVLATQKNNKVPSFTWTEVLSLFVQGYQGVMDQTPERKNLYRKFMQSAFLLAVIDYAIDRRSKASSDSGGPGDHQLHQDKAHYMKATLPDRIRLFNRTFRSLEAVQGIEGMLEENGILVLPISNSASSLALAGGGGGGR